MLSPANADLVCRDSWLPGLKTLLDPEAFLGALRASVTDADLRSAKLHYLRYKPGQNCLAAYTLDVNGRRVECHAKTYRNSDAVKLAKSSFRPANAGPLGAGRFVWSEHCVEVCVFPNDNKLESLALMADTARREDFLQRHLHDHPALWPAEIRTLAYKPERRWVGALEAGGQPQAVCRLYGDTTFDAVRTKAKHIAPGSVLRVAPLLGRSKGRRALFFGWQEGRLLSETLLEPDFDSSVMQPVGVALAELHRQGIPALPLVGRQAEAESSLALGDLLAFLLPELAVRLVSAARRLAGEIGGLPQLDATIHGDFYAKQVLLGVDSVTLLDLDEAGRGDPLSDLGAFLAHIEREVICGRLGTASRDGVRETLLHAYGTTANEPRVENVSLHIAAKLFARMPHFFRTCDPDWPALTEKSLARVESLLTDAGASEMFSPFVSVADPELPALSRALDAAAAGPLLTAALRERDAGVESVMVRDVQLRRHKPGRRALIEYRLDCERNDGQVESRTLLGKLHRRLMDAEHMKRLNHLVTHEFSVSSRDGISIPPVLGQLPELGMWLQLKINGQPGEQLLSTPAGSLAARRAAEAVCKLHRSGLVVRRTHTIADELRMLQDRFNALIDRRPAWQDRLARLFTACRRLAGELPAVVPRTIHRDFYHDQVLFEGERVWLVDLDLLCAGDPALDAGNFIGHLVEWAVRSPAEQQWLANAATAFTHRFLELATGSAGEAIDTYTTLTLARHIYISTQFPDRTRFTETILDLCEGRCGLARTRACSTGFTHANV